MGIKGALVLAIGLGSSIAVSAENDQIWRSFQSDYCSQEARVKEACEKAASYHEFEASLPKVVKDCTRKELAAMPAEQRKNMKMITLPSGLPRVEVCEALGGETKVLYKAYFAGASAKSCGSSARPVPKPSSKMDKSS